MKKIIGLLLGIVMILTSIPFEVMASEPTEDKNVIRISSYNLKENKNTIYENNEFGIYINFEVSGKIEKDNVSIAIDEGSAFIHKANDKDKWIKLDSEWKTKEFRLKYTGQGNKLPIIIRYTQGDKQMTTKDSIVISEAVSKSTEIEKEKEEKPVDTTKYIPRLNLVNKSIPTISAGQSETITFTIKNTGGYTAENIVVTPEFGDGSTPLTLEDTSATRVIKKISSDKSENISFKLTANSDAAEKSYPIKLNYSFTNAYDNPFTHSETVYVKVVNKNTPTTLVVDRVVTNPATITAGQKFKASFTIKNKGSLQARDVKYSLDGFAESGFSIVGGSNNKHSEVLAGYDQTVIEYDLQASKNIKNGSHALELKTSYKDAQNQKYEESHKVFITVGGSTATLSDLSIQNINYPREGVRPNQDVRITFDLRNQSKAKVSNVKVTLDSGDPAMVPKTANVKKIDNLDPGKVAKLDFTFFATSEATTKNYPISINVEFDNQVVAEGEEGKSNKITQYVGILVNGADSNKLTPRLIIDKYSFEPNIVRAGEKFDLNLSFINTNANKAISNVKIFLTVDEKTEQSGNVFTPVDSSNTFYIESIPAKGSIEKKLKFFTVPDAKAKTYTITANFEYQDETGKDITATELIGIPVVQKSKLEIGNMDIPAEGYVGMPIPISVQFFNTGKVPLNNMMIKLEGDFTAENGNYYLGNFEMGTTENYDGTIIPNKTGPLKGKLIFSYDNTAGEHIEQIQEININVLEGAPMDPNMPEEILEGNKKGMGTVLIWSISTIVVALAGFIIWRKRKKKKGETLDE
ncbi:COG1361 S-layer family protein [Clostridium sp. Marseille-Q7071]